MFTDLTRARVEVTASSAGGAPFLFAFGLTIFLTGLGHGRDCGPRSVTLPGSSPLWGRAYDPGDLKDLAEHD